MHEALIRTEIDMARRVSAEVNPPESRARGVLDLHALRPIGAKLVLMEEVEPLLVKEGRLVLIAGKGVHSDSGTLAVRPSPEP
ncbi:hypothetical protein JKP88DRAFT_273940 [Tribonema minus]|uniref:Uncharacterized protein n=1 Tax=Tribonema minus TaxID=303371 RepID=A0A835YP41_9STRA|nr:hypothetical protein JKP88DRAFT_273940 [Tribonema minus]